MSQTELPLRRSRVQQAFAALRPDLQGEDGPRISTMRAFRFAILQYDPEDEYELRAEVQRLTTELCAHGWAVLTLDLKKLLLDRVRAMGPEWLSRVEQRERHLAQVQPERGLGYLKDRLAPLIEGPDGLAADCSRIICEHATAHPDHADRTLVLIGRAGALYPFSRTSALLRHLDGRTANVPVVLLYPGTRLDLTSLSFMGVLPADSDYRPRIYP